MDINVKYKNTKYTFEDVLPGEMFEYNGGIFLKTRDNTKGAYIISPVDDPCALHAGSFLEFPPEEQIQPINHVEFIVGD